MSYIVSNVVRNPNQGGRKAASFKDGTFIRRVEFLPNNVIHFYSTEGELLYQEWAIAGLPFIVLTCHVETSSFSGTVILTLGGFTPDTSDSRVLQIVTDYRVQPPIYYSQQVRALAGEGGEEDDSDPAIALELPDLTEDEWYNTKDYDLEDAYRRYYAGEMNYDL